MPYHPDKYNWNPQSTQKVGRAANEYELDTPDPGRRAALGWLAGGAVVATGAAATWVNRDALGNIVEKGLSRPEGDEGYLEEPPVPVAHAELRPHRHFEPVGTRFSSEEGTFGDMVRSAEVQRQIDARFRGARILGGGPEDGVAYGIGEQSPIEFVRRHIYSATEGLPEWMRREMPSLAPALIAMESGFRRTAVNSESGASGAAQSMPDSWRQVEQDLRSSGKLGAQESLDPNSLNDVVAFVGGYFVNVYRDLQRRMRNFSDGGLALNQIRRRIYGYEGTQESENPENQDRRERFEREFLFLGIIHAYKMGVPYYVGLLNRFATSNLEDHVTELSVLPHHTHAVYGSFIEIMCEHNMNALDEHDEIQYVPIVMGMRERIDAAFPARR